MDIHNRLINLQTNGLFIFVDNTERRSSIIRKLLDSYNNEVLNGSIDLKNLEIFRMILCHEYQSSIGSPKSDCSHDEIEQKNSIDVTEFFVKNIEDFFDTEEYAVLYDIATLQLALFCDEKRFVRSFIDFYETRKKHLEEKHEATNLFIRVYECFADSFVLRSHLYNKEDRETDYEELRHCVMSAIESWMQQEEKIEWRLLASLLPKLVVIFGTTRIATPLWYYILTRGDHLDKTLPALCVIANICFPSKEEIVCSAHYEYCFEKKFWFVLRRGLISSIYEERKQALYLLKRVLDFVESHSSGIKNSLEVCSLSKKDILPFVCVCPSDKKHFTDEASRIFFLIFESLEEKQKHLVLPTLAHLPSFVKMYSERKFCCFNVSWLRCIFKRILQHDNIAVKIAGLREILRADLDVYDDDFVHFFANTLNQTLLYEYNEAEEKQPRIVNQLKELLLRSEESKTNLINTFVRTTSAISWCPVAIYWILQAIVEVTDQREIVYNTWTSEELKSIKSLMEKNLTMHCKVLRKHSMFLILRAFSEYTGKYSCQMEIEIIASIVTLLYESLGHESIVHTCITSGLSKAIQSSEAQLYVEQMCSSLLEKNSIKSCAIIVIFFAESNLILNAENCVAVQALCRLFENLIGAHVRPYADAASIARVMEFALRLKNLTHTFQSKTSFIVKRIFSGCWEDISRLIERIFEKTGITKFHEYRTVIDLLPCICRFENGCINEFFFRKLYSICTNILDDPKEFSKNQWLYALKIVNAQLSIPIRSTSRQHIEAYVQSTLTYFKDEISIKDERKNEEEVGFKGRFVWECCANVAKFSCQFIQTFENDFVLASLHKELHFLVEAGDEQVIIHVATMLEKLLDYWPSMIIIRYGDIVDSIIRSCWRSAFQWNKTEDFFLGIEKLTRVIVHRNFLELEGAKEFAIECAELLMEEGNNVSAFKIIFIDAISDITAEDALLFQKPLISCLFHGSVPRLDQRIELAAISHCINEPTQKDCEKNSQVRARSIHTLLSILNKSKDCELGKNVLDDILAILNKNRNKRYFHNSHLHRLKHRAMQVLLLMEPHLNQINREVLKDAMCDLLMAESNQQSVRLMQEWILVRMYKKSTTPESIWELFHTAAEKRPGSIVSIASIVFHISRILEEDERHKFIVKAISHLLPNCMSQQFNVRLYSQVILVKIYEMLPEAYPHNCTAIYEGVKESLSRGNIMKNSPKIMDDFYFTTFHPDESFNLEIIYHELPRLTGLPSDEWIKLSAFPSILVHSSKSFIQWISISKSSPNREAWLTMKPQKQSQRPTGDIEEEIETMVNEGFGDIQKKLIPWKSMAPFPDDLSEISKAALSKRNITEDDTGIIVVASLIDRPPNLGGLARTCEIFGAKELVIGSLRYVDDREFQALSVSAEKWIKITEVKSHLLKNYLLEQRSKGWKLVGAEQTANSTNLLRMNFDKKTILLLGNEKDGIPANLIQIMDTCVEIPQNGVVRSLNVHVTGAICIWQYAKQYFLS